MDDVQHFVLKQWHIVVLFLTMVGGIFKSEIASALIAIVIIVEQRELKGKTVQLLSADGSWKTVKILSYHYEVPFIKTGGVLLQHEPDDGAFIHEKVSFANWKSQRIRTLCAN